MHHCSKRKKKKKKKVKKKKGKKVKNLIIAAIIANLNDNSVSFRTTHNKRGILYRVDETN